MKVGIIGASGKTGIKTVREALKRGYEVIAVCRDSSVTKLDDFADQARFKVMTAPVVSDEPTLTEALTGCDAVVAVLITVRQLKATELVMSLAKATAATGVKRLVFTAGEVTVRIYPAGWIEETSVHLEGEPGNAMTLHVMPLTGTSEIFEGYKEF